MRNQGTWVECRVCTISAILITMSVGCAQDEGPARVNGFSRSPTIGSDLREVPRGITIPPPGLGVDLVQSPKSSPTIDTQAVTAGHTGPPGQAR